MLGPFDIRLKPGASTADAATPRITATGSYERDASPPRWTCGDCRQVTVIRNMCCATPEQTLADASHRTADGFKKKERHQIPLRCTSAPRTRASDRTGHGPWTPPGFSVCQCAEGDQDRGQPRNAGNPDTKHRTRGGVTSGATRIRLQGRQLGDGPMTRPLRDALREGPGPRGRQGRRIPLPAIPALSIAATLAGADSLLSISHRGRRFRPGEH